MSLKKEIRRNSSPAIRLAVVSMILCGLLFPIVITGLAQVLFPDQANGSLAHLNGSSTRSVGSYLIAQNFSQPYFFQPRNSSQSASGVDPDIILQDATSQVSRISNATGISTNSLNNLVNRYVEGTFLVFGYQYVNVLKLNLALVSEYQTIYQQLDPSLFVS